MQEIIRLLDQGANIDAAAALDHWVRDYNASMSTPPPSVRGRVRVGDIRRFEAECTLGPGQYE